jgi:hypothetical protein
MHGANYGLPVTLTLLPLPRQETVSPSIKQTRNTALGNTGHPSPKEFPLLFTLNSHANRQMTVRRYHLW